MIGQLRAHWNQKSFFPTWGRKKKNSKIFFFWKTIFVTEFLRKKHMKSSQDIRHNGQRFQGSFRKEFFGGHICGKNVDWCQSCSPVYMGAMCWGESKSTNLLKWSTSLISVNARGLISGKNVCWGHIFDMLRATKFLAKRRAHMRKKCWQF